MYPLTELDELKFKTEYFTFTGEEEIDIQSINSIIETSLRRHRIGSFTVTPQEYRQIGKIALGQETDLMTLSCRIRQTLRYFDDEDVTRVRNHIFCRNSLGICATKFALIERLIKEKRGPNRDSQTQKIDFVKFLFETCDVTENIFTLLHESFRIPRCKEHEECVQVNKLLQFDTVDAQCEQEMFFYSSCCMSKDCYDFTKQYIVSENPEETPKRCEVRIKLNK